MAYTLFLAGCTGLLALLSWRERRRARAGGPPGVFAGAWRNLAGSYVGWNLVLQLLAVGVTAGILAAGLDPVLLRGVDRAHLLGWRLSFGVLLVGNLWHVAAAGGLLLAARRRPALRGPGLAAMQAVLTTALLTGVQKLVSGRRGPLAAPGAPHPGGARFLRTGDPWDFRFDFWHHAWTDGRFFWPSGHTATIIAFVSAIVACQPPPRRGWYALYLLVALTGLAMMEGHFHWPSDVAAGALIGHAVGWTTGRYFRQRLRAGG
jgi:membrane-associated phospholipid phosphatase